MGANGSLLRPTRHDGLSPEEVTIARVESCSENGGTIDCKLYHKSYLKTYSIYFYFPEIIKIPKNCKTTLQAGQDYVLGYTYSYSNFYYYNFARPVNGLTGDERGFLGM
ncbi:hypothetical protein Y032_0061g3225 [Ancylostoma ceylanicum]|uniref:Uncharacterized protein n=1 Tax=Ancylostoma ceylanicum TaxID=53326 RepID=A0A016U2Y7_9BILA|nr:hypothetical protein Y032_0061g3225 [Ancylostoma ceylanicum]